jgi:2-oxoglutarate ferredoxin oxidoreductase subunit gamma
VRTEVRIVGLGGQGIILSGYIIGKAAAVFDGKHASLIQAYGPEARGSACHASLVVADKTIDYPQVTEPDILAIMSQEGFAAFAGGLRPGGTMLIDSGLVHPGCESGREAHDFEVHAIPATEMAEKIGRKIVANMVMLGFFTQATDLVTVEAMEQAIRSSVPKGTEALNLRAFRAGREYSPPPEGTSGPSRTPKEETACPPPTS